MLSKGIFSKVMDWGSAPDPGIYRFVPIPKFLGIDNPKWGISRHPNFGLGPGPALGSFPNVALSSVRFRYRIENNRLGIESIIGEI
jgi:hypothetical protein